ncbi:Aminoglycoside phosphotransferase [Niveomyces insectorum RCEF 264]|uniref:Aminoglycoside phosphotransferase n=1 Tax=Niveomyces insectorum RCEF 264 TaxID=1081102 RepID=A0A167LWH2_9HYPO|nr:Aminoglycoside phosphotransferase [Niveomyces insectorum RCEF 264]
MATPKFSDDVELAREYMGVPPPANAHLPTAAELLNLCGTDCPRGGVALPPEAPVFWVKHGHSVYWNEVAAGTVAYHELRRMNSPVRAPAVYYAFQYRFSKFIVMEYISGKTVGKCLEEAESDDEKERLRGQVVLCLSELHRIPIAPGSRPAAVDGDKIRHAAFDCQKAPRHYENADQLEEHMNRFLKRLKIPVQSEGLSREPMVFCHSDWYIDNFMIDDAGGAVVIDFADASILPVSFARHMPWDHRLGFDVHNKVWFPDSERPVENSQAVSSVAGMMPIGLAFFSKLSKDVSGGDEETQKRLADSTSFYFGVGKEEE